jgi:hypothetical protein
MLILSTELLNNKQYFKEIKAVVTGLQIGDKTGLEMNISDSNDVLKKDDKWHSLKISLMLFIRVFMKINLILVNS